MKKFLALVLAMMMVLAMGTVAFADGETTTTKLVSEEKKAEIKLNKIYTVTGATGSASIFPTETLKFTVSVPTGVTNPSSTMITVDDLVVDSTTGKINVNVPSYDTVGVYQYLITENEGAAQAVTYTKEAIAVTVLVTYNYDENKLDSEIVLSSRTDAEGDADGKVDTFTNTYELGHLTVNKTVQGNLASETTYFEMTVTLTADEAVESKITISGSSNENNPTEIAETDWTLTNGKYVATKTVYLKHTDTLTFSNIPAGVTYSVVEAAKHGVGEDGFNVNSAADTDYTVTYDNENGTIENEKTAAAKVVNEKKTTVNTGILLDNAPYMMIMAMVVLAGAAMMMKRRAY